MKKRFYVGSAGLLVAMLLGSCASGGGDSKTSQDSSDALSSSTLSEDASAITDKPEYVNGFYEYGYYPQTHVSDKETIAALEAMTSPQKGSWYLYKGDYYAKTAVPWGGCRYFDDGVAIEEGTTYWFKCERIQWKVFKSGYQTKLVSAKLLDTVSYAKRELSWGTEKEECLSEVGYYLNNYKESLVREWLNNEFYNEAFSIDDSYLLTTEVDNSAATTNNLKNEYACENTNDKVYLLSYKECKTYFSKDSSRACLTTDWARAKGAGIGITPDVKNQGNYWTRSPCIDSFHEVSRVVLDGTLDTLWGDYWSCPSTCARPAIALSQTCL